MTKILHGYTCSFIIIIKWHCFSRFAFLYRGIIIKAIQFSHLTYSIANSLHLFWNPCVVCCTCYNYCCWTNFSNYEFHEPIIKMRSYSCDFMTTRIVLVLFFMLGLSHFGHIWRNLSHYSLKIICFSSRVNKGNKLDRL